MKKDKVKIYIALGILLFIVLAGVFGVSLLKDKQGGNNQSMEEKIPAPKENESETKDKIEISKEEKERHERLMADKEEGLFVLVNKENPVDNTYKPEDLETVKYFAADRTPVGRTMRKNAVTAFNSLSEAAAAEGHEIVVTTAFRSYDFQSNLYNNYVNSHGQEEADTFSAQPGKSEHQTGLAADVSSPSVGYQLTQEYINAPEGKWLSENAHSFGFIIRFPKGKEDITGYMYEPWHIRYVGKTAAKEIYEMGITLEEYLEKETKNGVLF